MRISNDACVARSSAGRTRRLPLAFVLRIQNEFVAFLNIDPNRLRDSI